MLRMTIVRRPTQTLCNCPCLQCNQQEIDKEKNSQKCLHSLGRPGQMMMRLPHWAHICDTGADCWYCDDVTQILETCDKMIHGCDTLCDTTRPQWSETEQYFTGIFGHHWDNAHRCQSQNDPQNRSSCLVVAILNLFSPHSSGNILSYRSPAVMMVIRPWTIVPVMTDNDIGDTEQWEERDHLKVVSIFLQLFHDKWLFKHFDCWDVVLPIRLTTANTFWLPAN